MHVVQLGEAGDTTFVQGGVGLPFEVEIVGGIGIAAMAESRLAGDAARAREWLPIPLALATVAALLIYTAASMAQSAFARGDYDRAITALGEVVARPPEVPELRVELGEALRQSGRLPEAAAVYRELLQHASSVGRRGP